MNNNLSIEPYRTNSLECSPPIRTGLVILKERHKCSYPAFYKETIIKKIFFGLITYKSVKCKDIPEGSLFRCPICLEISMKRFSNWRLDSSGYKNEWEEMTGEKVIDGIPF